MKATVDEQILHQRLLEGEDPVAFAELAEAFYSDVVRKTRARAGPAADPVLVEEAVGKAFLDYNEDPKRYNPELSSLRTYLIMAAYRDFQKARNREYRWAQRQVRSLDKAYIDDDNETTGNNTEQLIICCMPRRFGLTSGLRSQILSNAKCCS
jgi:DNA-directed RNA polymerase specialized sigma24 family protein